MKHIKNYKELFEAQTELSQEQREWLDKCSNQSWTLNPQTGLVDVKGDFICSGQDLTDFKGVRFGVVTGNFYCHNNRITSLVGAPQKVGGSFYCYNNSLSSLEGAPQEVRGNFYCHNSRLTSLEGAPRNVGGSFYCRHNSLTSLEGAPLIVRGDFDCIDNQLTTLVGAPPNLGGGFNCSNNRLTSLVGAPQKVGAYFSCYNNSLTSVEGAPLSGGLKEFEAEGNPVSERTIKGIYKKMQSGLSWPDAVANFWGYIRSEEDKILLAQYNPNFSPDEIKGYQALGKFRKKII